jgi:uncharacterized membrane protein YkvA (DUF1232 family)
MPAGEWLLVAGGAVLVAYLLAVAALLLAGRRTDARAWAGFIPDCVVLARRLLADGRLPRRWKLLLGGLVLYLAMPFDLVPDFLPVIGQADDAIVVALVLRGLSRAAWPGPRPSVEVVLRLAGLSGPRSSS